MVVRIFVAHLFVAAGFVVYGITGPTLSVPLFLFGQALVAACWLTIGVRKAHERNDRRALLVEHRGLVVRAGLCFGAALFIYFVCFFNAIRESSASNVSLLLALQPGLIILLLWALWREPFRYPALVVAGVLISLLGVLVYKRVIALDGGMGNSLAALSKTDLLVVGALATGVFKALVIASLSRRLQELFPLVIQKPHRGFLNESALVCGFWTTVALSFLYFAISLPFEPMVTKGAMLGLLGLAGIFFCGIVPVGIVERAYQAAQDMGMSVFVFSTRQVVPIAVYGLTVAAASIGVPVVETPFHESLVIGAVLIGVGVALTVIGKGKSKAE